MSSFWFLVNVKNGKDPTDRHWNMNFFSGKLTDKDGKQDDSKTQNPGPLAGTCRLPTDWAQGRFQSKEGVTGCGVGGGCES